MFLRGFAPAKALERRVIAFTTTVPPTELTAAGADWILPNCGAIQLNGARGALELSLELLSNENFGRESITSDKRSSPRIEQLRSRDRQTL